MARTASKTKTRIAISAENSPMIQKRPFKSVKTGQKQQISVNVSEEAHEKLWELRARTHIPCQELIEIFIEYFYDNLTVV